MQYAALELMRMNISIPSEYCKLFNSKEKWTKKYISDKFININYWGGGNYILYNKEE